MANGNLSNDIQRIESATMADMVELRLREFLKRKLLNPVMHFPKNWNWLKHLM
ncbi:hypothetical protein [Niabella hibiscisoli]|uniref:hypothetical protein n=1 Tax=Niabella hibiscisoli TaxID=1825928 RepID=UPI001F0E1C14|nr:hypothetical protein [Niabella hibiscisoli]MCH5720048.1 hypothetical protein [Niabella hibiscisoli]